jgi:tRNA/rRNA methyltransferase
MQNVTHMNHDTASSLKTQMLFSAQKRQKIRWVLDQTSHPGNIGAVCRALFCTGFDRLSLVNPRYQPSSEQAEALAFAGHAEPLLKTAKEYQSLDQALYQSDLRVAFTFRKRRLEPPDISIKDLPKALNQHLEQGGQEIALLFGNERTGLSSEQVQQCNLICTIPTDTPTTSLNLAQAVQIVAYEVFTYPSEKTSISIAKLPDLSDRLATHEEIQGLINHWYEALIAIDYIDPQHPKFLLEKISLIFQRSQLHQSEIHLLRGIAKKMQEK